MDQKFDGIIEEIIILFNRYGIRSVSMDDISRELKISKKTLYQYVDNKSDLLEKIYAYQSVKTDEKYKKAFEEGENAIDALLSISQLVHWELQEITSKFLFDLRKYYPEISQRLFQKKRNYVLERVKSNIYRGIEEGVYRTDLSVDLVSGLYLKKVEALHEPDTIIAEDPSIRFEAIFNVMFDTHIRGISNANGLKYYQQNQKRLKLIE